MTTRYVQHKMHRIIKYNDVKIDKMIESKLFMYFYYFRYNERRGKTYDYKIVAKIWVKIAVKYIIMYYLNITILVLTFLERDQIAFSLSLYLQLKWPKQ